MLAGGDSIDDTALLRAAAAEELFDATPGALDDRVVAAGAQVDRQRIAGSTQPSVVAAL